MNIQDVPFTQTDWDTVPREQHAGETGTAWWRVVELGNLRLRMVEYSPGYCADHWCSRGHVVLVLRGEIETSLRDGRVFITRQGQSWQAADSDGEHRTSTRDGATLFIVD